jgi:hypothetical protein
METSGKWSGSVKAKWKVPEGLFTKPSGVIAKTLAANSKSLKQAMNRLTFYENRAGSNLPPSERANLEKAKTELRRIMPDKKPGAGSNATRPALPPRPERKARKGSPAAKREAKKAAVSRRAPRAIEQSLAPVRARVLQVAGPREGAIYWYAVKEDGRIHWRKGSSRYRNEGRQVLSSSTTPVKIAVLGDGLFRHFTVRVRNHVVHVAQFA